MDASSVGSKPDVSREELQELAAEVRALAARVASLERARDGEASIPPASVPQVHISGDIAPAIGRALLVIAGAYLLRALTEFGVLPPRMGAGAGIIYAAVWFALGGRSQKKIAATLDTIASLLILAPLLWEATLRLNAIPTWTAAAILAVFALAAAWYKNIVGIATAGCALIATALLIGSHHLVAFTVALLAAAAVAEFSDAGSRWLVALLADLAIAIFTYLIARGLPDGYAPATVREAVLAQIVLLALYAGSALRRRRQFSAFEIAQLAAAFLFAAGGAFYLTKTVLPIAVCLLLASTLCYALLFFRSLPERNRWTIAIIAIALALAGITMITSGVLLVAFCSLLAFGVSRTRTAAFQAPLYLWWAALISGVAGGSKLRVWDGGRGPFPAMEAVILLAAAFACYLLASELITALTLSSLCLLIAAGVASLWAPGALVLPALAIASAWIGVRNGRVELVGMMYALMTVAAAKILIRDLAQQRSVSLLISLLLYGLALIILPRILARRQAALEKDGTLPKSKT